MNKIYKTFTVIFVAVFITCCLTFVGVAQPTTTTTVNTTTGGASTKPITTSSIHTTQPTIDDTSEQTQTSSLDWTTDFSTEETTQEITTHQSTTITTTKKTTGRWTPPPVYQTQDDRTYTKQTKAITTTVVKTTEPQKNIVDYSAKFKLIKYVSLILMILSLLGLILVNYKYSKNNPKKAAKRKHKKKSTHKRK